MEKRKYNNGDPIEVQSDWNTSTFVTNTPVTVYKGTVGIITAQTEAPAVLFPNGHYALLSTEWAELTSKYNLQSIAAWLWYGLCDEFALDDMLSKEYDVEVRTQTIIQAIIQTLADMLYDLGFEPAETQSTNNTGDNEKANEN